MHIHKYILAFATVYQVYWRGHSGRVVTLLPPTSEAGVRIPARQAWGQVHGAKYKYKYFEKLLVQVQVLL